MVIASKSDRILALGSGEKIAITANRAITSVGGADGVIWQDPAGTLREWLSHAKLSHPTPC